MKESFICNTKLYGSYRTNLNLYIINMNKGGQTK